jgi:hypothetical protein
MVSENFCDLNISTARSASTTFEQSCFVRRRLPAARLNVAVLRVGELLTNIFCDDLCRLLRISPSLPDAWIVPGEFNENDRRSIV